MVTLSGVPAVRPGRWLHTALVTALVVAVIGQLVVLYVPRPPDGLPLFPHADKVIHVGIFAVPALLAVLIGRSTILLPLLVVHAPVSEIIQGVFLPGRGMDPFDVVADLVGVTLGWWVGTLLGRRLSGR